WYFQGGNYRAMRRPSCRSTARVCLSATAEPCYRASMPHLPDFETFARLAKGHQLVPVYRRMLSDALTPVTAFALLGNDNEQRGEQACLFESVVGGEKVGRYSLLAVEPFWELVAHGTRVTVRGEAGR